MLTLINKLNERAPNGRNRGSAMLLVIMTMSVILVIGTSMLFVTLSSYSRSISDTQRNRAYNAAMTVSESIRSNVQAILPLYSGSLTADVNEDNPIPVQFENGASAEEEIDGSVRTVPNRVLDLNGVRVRADIYQDEAMYSSAIVKVTAQFRSQESEVKFRVLGASTGSYEYVDKNFGNAFTMGSSLGQSDNDFSLMLRRVEGDVSIDVPAGETRSLNAKIVEGITGSVYADGNLIIGSETNVVQIQGNVYVNGNLTIRGADVGGELPTIYSKADFGDIEYFAIDGTYHEAGKGVDGEGMYWPYVSAAPTDLSIDDYFKFDNRKSGRDIGYKDYWLFDAYFSHKLMQICKIKVPDKSGEKIPMQLYTKDSRPIVDAVNRDGKTEKVEGYYDKHGKLKVVYEEDREKFEGCEEPVTGEMMFRSTEQFVEKYGRKNYPNFVPRYPIGGNIYCSGDLIIDKANKGYVAKSEGGIDTALSQGYIVDMTATRRYSSVDLALGTGPMGPRWVPNRSLIRGDIFVRGRMVYAPDNLGVHSYKLNGTTYVDKAVDDIGEAEYMVKNAHQSMKNENSSYADIFNKKVFDWFRWKIIRRTGENVYYQCKTQTDEEPFLKGIVNSLKDYKNTFDNVFGEGDPLAEKVRNNIGLTNDYSFTKPSELVDKFDKTYTQIEFGDDTEIFIQNAAADYYDTSGKPATNQKTTLKWTKKDGNGNIVTNDDGSEKYYTVGDGITAALTVKFHDKFDVAGIYANGEIDAVSSNIVNGDKEKEKCIIKTNLGKDGATVWGQSLKTSCYESWNMVNAILEETSAIGGEDEDARINRVLDEWLDLRVEVKMTVHDDITEDITDTHWVHKKDGTVVWDITKTIPAWDWNKISATDDSVDPHIRGYMNGCHYDAGDVRYYGDWQKGDGRKNISIINSKVYGLYGTGDAALITDYDDVHRRINAGSGILIEKNDHYRYIKLKDLKKKLDTIKGIVKYNSEAGRYEKSGYGTAADRPYSRYHFTKQTNAMIENRFNDSFFYDKQQKASAFYLYKRYAKYAYPLHNDNTIDNVKGVFDELSDSDFAKVTVKETKKFTSSEPITGSDGETNPNNVSLPDLVSQGAVKRYVCFSKEKYRYDDGSVNERIWPITFYTSDDFVTATSAEISNAGIKKFAKAKFEFAKPPTRAYVNDDAKWVLVWENNGGTPTERPTDLYADCAATGTTYPSIGADDEGRFTLNGVQTELEHNIVLGVQEKDGKTYYTIPTKDDEGNVSNTLTEIEVVKDEEGEIIMPVPTFNEQKKDHKWKIGGNETSVNVLASCNIGLTLDHNSGKWLIGGKNSDVSAKEVFESPRIEAVNKLWNINEVASNVPANPDVVTSDVCYVEDSNGTFVLHKKNTTETLEMLNMDKDPMHDLNAFESFWGSLEGIIHNGQSTINDDETRLNYKIDEDTYWDFSGQEVIMNVSGGTMSGNEMQNLIATRRIRFIIDTSAHDVKLYISAQKLMLLKATFEVQGEHDFYIILVDDTDIAANTYMLAINIDGNETDARLGTHFLSDEQHGGNLYIVGSGQNTVHVGRGGQINGYVYLPNGTYSTGSVGLFGLAAVGTSQNNKSSIVAKNIKVSASNRGKLTFTSFDNDSKGGGMSFGDIFEESSDSSTTATGSTTWKFVGYID